MNPQEQQTTTTRSSRKPKGRREKLVCDQCGGPMEKRAYGGEMLDMNGKWVKSNRESWSCKRALDAYSAERRRAVATIDADLARRFGDHIKWVEYEVVG